MVASVGLMIFGTSRSSKRTSRGPCKTARRKSISFSFLTPSHRVSGFLVKLVHLGAYHREVQRLNQLRCEPHILGWMSRLRSQKPVLATASYFNRLIALRPVLNELAWTEQLPELAHIVDGSNVRLSASPVASG